VIGTVPLTDYVLREDARHAPSLVIDVWRLCKPETKTSPAAFTAWLYVAGGFAALGVKTSRAISCSLCVNVCEGRCAERAAFRSQQASSSAA